MHISNLILEDGTVFEGVSPRSSEGFFYPVRGSPPKVLRTARERAGATSNGIYGEVVFSTGMTGYVESLTDPSYSGQILVFTYPLIGNYGVHEKKTWESEKIHAAGVVTSEVYGTAFTKWLADQKIPLITGVDTRALTKYLRSRGTMLGGTKKIKNFSIPFVSISKPILYNTQFKKTIILVDCGMKMNILRELMKLPFQIKRVPRDYDYSKEDFAGVFLSNGPGDPADYVDTIRVARNAMRQNRPIMGICLGSQIMGLAAGAKTYKLKFGHRGHNQPVQMDDGKCYITSQNHGYAVNEKTLPGDWYVNFRNLNDGSVEGVAHKTKPFFSVQFHPESHPGPTDTEFLFENFKLLILNSK